MLIGKKEYVLKVKNLDKAIKMPQMLRMMFENFAELDSPRQLVQFRHNY